MTEAGGGSEHAAPLRVVKNSIWLIAQPLLMNAISLFAVAYIARVLGKENYGRFIYAISFTQMFMPLTNLGLRLLTVRDIATQRDGDVSDYIGRMSVLRFTLAVFGTCLAIGVVSVVQQSPETRNVVYLASLIIVLNAVTTTVTDVFQAFETMRLVAQVQFVSGLLLTVLSVAVLFLGGGLLGVMSSYVVGNAVGTVLALYYLYTRFTVPKMSVDLRFWKQSLIKGAPFFIPTMISYAGSRLGVVILEGKVDEKAVGTYGAANTLLEKIQVIPDGVCSALFPTLAATFMTSREEAAALYRRFFGYFFILGLPIAVGTGVLAEPIVLLIYGDRYQGSPLVLAILVWGLFATFFSLLLGWTLGAIHQEKRASYPPIVATALHLVAAVILIPRYQEVGLAVANVVLSVTTVVLFWVIIRAHLTARSIEFRIVWRVILANLVMGAATYAVRGWPVLVSIAVGAVTYAVMVLALRILSPKELKGLAGLIKGRFRKRPPDDDDD
jgi:O-antigen/teichoic acid export membrane protein